MEIADFKKSILSYTQIKQIKEMEIYGMLAFLWEGILHFLSNLIKPGDLGKIAAIDIIFDYSSCFYIVPELNLLLLSYEASCFCMI